MDEIHEIFRQRLGEEPLGEKKLALIPSPLVLEAVEDPTIKSKVTDAVYLMISGKRRSPDCTEEDQDYWLRRDAAVAFFKAQEQLLRENSEPIRLRDMNAAGRTAEDRKLIHKCAPNQIHARKRSTHELGISIDVDNYEDQSVREALAKFGFVRNVPNDLPHFTYLSKPR